MVFGNVVCVMLTVAAIFRDVLICVDFRRSHRSWEMNVVSVTPILDTDGKRKCVAIFREVLV